MKIRKFFISNSSSSSFVCSICGEIESGMDASASDFGMKTCERSHSFHDDCNKMPAPTSKELEASILGYVKREKYIEEADKENYRAQVKDAEGDEEVLNDIIEELFEGGVPACKCPICSFVQIDSGDAVEYLYKKLGTTAEKLAKEIKGRFEDYSEFKAYSK